MVRKELELGCPSLLPAEALISGIYAMYVFRYAHQVDDYLARAHLLEHRSKLGGLVTKDDDLAFHRANIHTNHIVTQGCQAPCRHRPYITQAKNADFDQNTPLESMPLLSPCKARQTTTLTALLPS